MEDWTQRGLVAARKVFRHAWLLLAIGLVVALADQLAAGLVGALSGPVRIIVSTLATALLELGLVLAIFGRLLVRAAGAGLLSDLGRRGLGSSRNAHLARAGVLLLVEVLALTLAAWLVYRWSIGGLDLEPWPFTPALPFLMIADMMSFVALVAAVAMIVVGVARALVGK